MTFDTATSLRLIAESLGLVDRLGAKPIHVRKILMADRTLIIEIDVTSEDPVTLRGEIAGVMGGLSGLDVPTIFPTLGAEMFGVRAFTAGKSQELLWIVSSIEAAGFAGKGQPVEWLSRSLVQENTPSFRRSQADRRTGQLETALRDLIDLHAPEEHEGDYPSFLWAGSEVRRMRKDAEAESRDTDSPRALVDFAYLPQLRDAVEQHPDWFDDGCIPTAGDFRGALTRLNKVRRKVAHNRPVTEDDLRICNEAADALLAPIGHAHPDLAPDFVIDRWEDEIKRIVDEAQRAIRSPSVPERGTVSETERQAAAVEGLELQLAGVVTGLEALNRLVVPVMRRRLHEAAVDALTRWRDGLQALIDVGKRPNLTLAEVEAARIAYSVALDEVAEVRRKIREMRVGASAT